MYGIQSGLETSLMLRTSTTAAWVRCLACLRQAPPMTKSQNTCGDTQLSIWVYHFIRKGCIQQLPPYDRFRYPKTRSSRYHLLSRLDENVHKILSKLSCNESRTVHRTS